MAACAEVISPLAFYGAPKSQLYAVLSCKNYFSAALFFFRFTSSFHCHSRPCSPSTPGSPGAAAGAARRHRCGPEQQFPGTSREGKGREGKKPLFPGARLSPGRGGSELSCLVGEQQKIHLEVQEVRQQWFLLSPTACPYTLYSTSVENSKPRWKTPRLQALVMIRGAIMTTMIMCFRILKRRK